ncbi:MAG: bis(5'-nucleosyl)-tetraphosphatase (symmetrical) YqeK [Oscillospiraceae bacterium]|nr:bis(5'-nucleosyl)-tetraphosphatase (symmetrical) YqeK [Oscillospiraceae bacterium]
MSQHALSFTDLELAALRKRAYTMLDEKRIPHVAGCEEEAVCLAERWGEVPSVAAAAAILHDCTKRLSYKEQLALVKKYGISCDDALLASPKLLHAVTGAAVAEAEFHMPGEICSAIRWHTTGKPEMTLLEKIIYLADYVEPTRDFPGLEKLRKSAYDDLDSALALGLAMSLEEISRGGSEPYIDSILASQYYHAERNSHAIS